MTELENLRIELRKIDSYPLGLEMVDCGIIGKGFFPGARGLWKDADETLSDKPIMFLGHDFGAIRDYKNSVIRSEENFKALTWKNLNSAMDDYGINPKDCFFTNSIMGVRSEGLSSIGQSPAVSDKAFLDACHTFLIKQISIQKPKLIICLGLQILGFISQWSTRLSELSKIKSFKKLDSKNLSAFEDIEFNAIPNYKTNLIFITHPTYRHLNVDHRKFNGLIGVYAEKELISQFL